MADFNQDGISEPADSTVVDGQPVDSQSGLSVSRRVKIGIVLLLMSCVYFVMEDRPRPATLVADAVGVPLTDDSQMQAFMDDLDFVQSNDSQQPSPRESQAGTLTLPDSIESVEPYPAVSSTTPPLPTGHQQNSSPPNSARHAFAADESHSMPHRPTPPEPVRPMVRFTGRIEIIR